MMRSDDKTPGVIPGESEEYRKEWLHVYRTPSYKKPGRHPLIRRYHNYPYLSNILYAIFNYFIEAVLVLSYEMKADSATNVIHELKARFCT